MDTTAKDRMIASITCSGCELNGPAKQPFFRAKLDRQQSAELIEHLEQCANVGKRQWFLLLVTYDDTTRLRLMQQGPPAYEANAAEVYLRGEVLKVTGQKDSCNIEFSGRVGAPLLVERLQTVRQRMRRFLEIRVPNRWSRRNLIEFIPDTELEAAKTAEHHKLALAGEALTGEAWTEDDFSDWESQDA